MVTTIKDSSKLTQRALFIGVVVACVRVGLGVPFKHNAGKSRG